MWRVTLAAVGLAALGVGCGAAAAVAAEITGTPRIVDGDTVEVAGTKIRLNGIDAPETDQVCFDAKGARWTCGVAARDALERRFGGKPWTCAATGTDRYGRTLGSCRADGEDVQRWLVAEGLALSFVRYAHTYDADERGARTMKVGLWAGCFIAPWEWRARNEKTVLQGSVCPVGAQKDLLSPASAAAAPTPDCAIKGNVNRQGECIYHVPGGRFYAAVKMDLAKGKRWFCSRAEAEAAGCRASKQ